MSEMHGISLFDLLLLVQLAQQHFTNSHSGGTTLTNIDSHYKVHQNCPRYTCFLCSITYATLYPSDAHKKMF